MKKLIKSSKWARRIKWSILTGTILIFAVIVCANYAVRHTAKAFIYQNIDSIPQNKAGLLLGTSKLLRSGLPNQYFQNRIQATVDLYKAGKIEVVVISGDNSRKGYNEPEDMKSELMLRGIPEDKIYLDAYSGFKTQLREKFARVKLFLDLWTGKNPKFLGEPVIIQ
mgnify:CR=1 FL=1